MDIIGNLICNNQHTSGSCGEVDGGGALNLNTNSAVPVDSTFYNVINNVIANNYSPFHGGAISILNAPVNIINNQIINNSSVDAGAIYSFGNYNMKIKNNIFFGNTTSTLSSAASPNLVAFTNASIEYDHNWIESSPGFNLNVAGTFTITGDTSTNIQGSTPGLVSPTSTVNVSEIAIDSNFSLLPSSPCIDMGDTTGIGALVGNTDYAGNCRIFGSAIDIGAFEYGASPLFVPPVIPLVVPSISVYPNPAMNLFFVSTPEAYGAIDILDISGKTVIEKQVISPLTYFDVQAIPRGLYIATWHNVHGCTQVQKVVVQ